jgi:hypothetical protein
MRWMWSRWNGWSGICSMAASTGIRIKGGDIEPLP